MNVVKILILMSTYLLTVFVSFVHRTYKNINNKDRFVYIFKLKRAKPLQTSQVYKIMWQMGIKVLFYDMYLFNKDGYMKQCQCFNSSLKSQGASVSGCETVMLVLKTVTG